MMYNKKHEEMKQEAILDIINALENGYDGYYCDLHNEVFNTDWYIIGTYSAKEALKEYDVFEAIELVMEYEKDAFGEVTTEIYNPEKLINMVYYIIGEEAIGEVYNDVEAFNENWDNRADEETNMIIVEAIKEMFGIE